MDSRVIQLTPAAQKYGNLNIRSCGRSFFPIDVFGGPSKSKEGVPITLTVSGFSHPIKTDIPSDARTGAPLWIFRERSWVKKFIHLHELHPGDAVLIARVGRRSYKVSPNNGSKVLDAINKSIEPYHTTKYGKVFLGDSLYVLADTIAPASVDLIMTSPPFGLVRKKDYGNANAKEYVKWFKPFGKLFHHLLKPNGSLVIDIGGSWNPGVPTRSLYVYDLLLTLCKECSFNLAEEFFWWNPSKLPTPAEWVTVRRIRVKDAVNFIWWLSPTPWPKASNRRVLAPYSEAMRDLLKNGYKAKLRPSGHDISEKFVVDNKAAIPPNLIAVANTESNSPYLRYCKKNNLTPHPARFPSDIPEYFIRMLTDPGDFVIDPFAGSCVTGEVSERLERYWICVDNVEEYLKGAIARFGVDQGLFPLPKSNGRDKYYRVYRPSATWRPDEEAPLASDGGKTRPNKKKHEYSQHTGA